jgi:hypothetical protein
MQHVVYLEAKANELEQILSGEKTMLIRSSADRQVPYDKVNVGDTLYFLRNNGEGLIRAKATVSSVHNSEKLTKVKSLELVEQNMDKLQLTEDQVKRWGGKRYVVLVGIDRVIRLYPFDINKSKFGNMDDWIPIKDIEKIKIVEEDPKSSE